MDSKSTSNNTRLKKAVTSGTAKCKGAFNSAPYDVIRTRDKTLRQLQSKTITMGAILYASKSIKLDQININLLCVERVIMRVCTCSSACITWLTLWLTASPKVYVLEVRLA